MDIILWLALGAVAGFLAVLVVYRTIPDTPMEWAGALIVGLIGGWVGGFVADLLDLKAVSWLGSLVIAFAAALALLMLLRRVSPGRRA
ncbi:MAG TPA: GlsB/YeaQ/YmgE family stress response membrane protein [Thermomicrobiales bacterium]|nr:GlsB/YeaQ/YmgE family stress response membrane protein [Thermomicrobiales bacterium]